MTTIPNDIIPANPTPNAVEPARADGAEPVAKLAQAEAEIARLRRENRDLRHRAQDAERGRDANQAVADEYLERAEAAEADNARLREALNHARRVAAMENDRANRLAAVIRDCPEARDVWGARIADEAAEDVAALAQHAPDCKSDPVCTCGAGR